MLHRQDIYRIIGDVFRTELSSHQADALAVFDNDTENLWVTIPADIKNKAEGKIAVMFGFEPRKFSTLDRLVDYAYASFLNNQQIVFLTSGSDGQLKPCVHTVNQMWEEARGVSSLFTGVKRVVSLVPANYSYGFTFTVLLPHILHVPVLVLPAIPTQSWQTLLRMGDLMVGFPLFWNYWLRCENKFPPQVQVLSSTAICKDETIEGLLANGVSRFTEIYGFSETGAVAFRRQAKEPFEILPFWDISRKEKNPLLKRSGSQEWHSLPDQVIMSGERFLYPVSRLDDCVQIAGENVYPKKVEAVLSRHPAIKECRVRLMRPDEGERLKAFIVLKEGYGPEQISTIRQVLAEELTAHEMPRTFTFGEMLPVLATGKESDW